MVFGFGKKEQIIEKEEIKSESSLAVREKAA